MRLSVVWAGGDSGGQTGSHSCSHKSVETTQFLLACPLPLGHAVSAAGVMSSEVRDLATSSDSGSQGALLRQNSASRVKAMPGVQCVLAASIAFWTVSPPVPAPSLEALHSWSAKALIGCSACLAVIYLGDSAKEAPALRGQG